MNEKERIQAAAVLCGKRNKLSEQIVYKESQLLKEFDVEKQLKVGCVISIILDKNKFKKRVKKFIKNNKSAYEQKNTEIHEHNRKIKSEIYEISSKKTALEKEMKDRTICCIHPDYWYAGPQLFYLIDTGRADTLKEAINLFENIKENERRRLAEESAAEERRWEKIENMLEEDEKLDKLKRTIKSAINDIL